MTISQSHHSSRQGYSQRLSQAVSFLTSLALGATLVGCDSVATSQYGTSATTTYTWQVEYIRNPDKPNQNRREQFASTSLEITNGEQPSAAVTGPDDKGLWWPELPPRPTVDELEARQQPQETIGTPELLKRVDYTATFQDEDGQTKTLPTDYDVYRSIVKALPNQQPLQFLVDRERNWVQQATAR